jgi:hypothetical protein
MSRRIGRRLALILALICAACKPAPPKPAAPAAAVPTVRATVMTLRTTIEPGSRKLVHTIVIAGDRARSTAEHDTWRLFDTKAKTVTFVDDIERTIRTEPLAALATRRREAMTNGLPPHYPNTSFLRGDESKPILGVNARRSVIASGDYRRELWLADHPQVPRALFAMMAASEMPSSPLAPMMRKVDEALAAIEGFPLIDHSEVPFGKKKFVVDRVVTNITQGNVPQSAITLPAGYRDLSAKAK